MRYCCTNSWEPKAPEDLKGNGRKQSTQELNVKDVVHKVQLCNYSTYVEDLEQNILHQ